MKTQKMNFANIQGKLSKNEMAKIMAGSGSCGGDGAACDTSKQINCCNGLRCTDFRCGFPT